MKLQEALELLKEGHQMWRQGWLVKDGYVTLMPGMTHVWKVAIQPQTNAGNYMWSYADLIADDWERFVIANPEKDCEDDEKPELPDAA